RPRGRRVLPGLRGVSPGLAGVRRDGGRLCHRHHQPGPRRCRSRTARRPVWSADTFTVLRVKPVLGRDFSAADDRPGAEAVVIITSNVWKSRYAASRDVLGRKVTVNAATPATIIGVMPDGVRFIDFTVAWMPLAQMPGIAAQRRDTRPLMMIGRLPDDAELDRVRVDLTPIAANLAVAHPDTHKAI